VTNVALVTRKLTVLLDHLQRLRERRPASLELFTADNLLQDAVALSVLVIVQESIDISFHICSDEGWELAKTYREIFAVLERHGLIDSELRESLAAAAQLRNRIAHGYASLDAARLWLELPGGIAAFSAFAQRVARHLTESTT
jgi:uncharacterized protein YutE (UPF0331/DUF86 family)